MNFLKLCVCASFNTSSDVWRGWPPLSTSNAVVEARRGLLICWVLLRESAADVAEWHPLPGDDDDDEKDTKADTSVLEEAVSWCMVKKAVMHVSETACVGWSEAHGTGVFA
jgi:hypothetical protein